MDKDGTSCVIDIVTRPDDATVSRRSWRYAGCSAKNVPLFQIVIKLPVINLRLGYRYKFESIKRPLHFIISNRTKPLPNKHNKTGRNRDKEGLKQREYKIVGHPV